MSDGRVHISGIELHMMPGCQEETGQGLHEGCKCGHGEGTERRDTKKVEALSCPLWASQPEHAEGWAPLGSLAGSGGLGVRAQGAPSPGLGTRVDI